MAKILLVDDDLVYLDELSQALGTLAHDVTCTTSTTEAKLRLQEERFDIILCDMIMAGGGAVSLLHDVRLSYPDLPFLAITGRSEIATSPLFVSGMTEAHAKLQKSASIYDIDRAIRSFVSA